VALKRCVIDARRFQRVVLSFAGEVQKHAFLNSALDLNSQLHFSATIGHEENTLHSKDRNVWT